MRLIQRQSVGLPRDPLPDDVELPLEPCLGVRTVATAAAAADEHLPYGRLALTGGLAERGVVGWDVPPAEQGLRFLRHDPRHKRFDAGAFVHPAWQEQHADAVLPGGRQREPERGGLPAQELVGYLQQQSGAVAGVRLAPACPAMQQVERHFERLVDELVRADTLDVDHETDTAGVMLEPGVVETLNVRCPGWL